MTNQPNPKGVNTEAIFRNWLIIWGGLLMACVMFALLSWFVAQPQKLTGGDNFMPLFAGLLIAALGALAVSFVLKSRQLAQAVEQQKPALLQSGYVAAWALCEAACLCGMLGVFATKALAFFALMALGILGLLVHFPKRDDLHATVYKRN
jgi:flagellar biosynthesis component FlhA